VPARGLLGFRTDYLTETRGTGIMSHVFHEYGEHRGDIPQRTRGALVCKEDGTTTGFSLANLEERGVLFAGPGVPVYTGMIVGENSREGDLIVNPCKRKHLTNIRPAGAEDLSRLTPPRNMSLEDCMEFIADDELVEVTPKNIRLRKRLRSAGERKRERSKAEAVAG